jgi:hypothetical protein
MPCCCGLPFSQPRVGQFMRESGFFSFDVMALQNPILHQSTMNYASPEFTNASPLRNAAS